MTVKKSLPEITSHIRQEGSAMTHQWIDHSKGPDVTCPEVHKSPFLGLSSNCVGLYCRVHLSMYNIYHFHNLVGDGLYFFLCTACVLSLVLVIYLTASMWRRRRAAIACYITLKIRKTFMSVKSRHLAPKNKPCNQGCLTVCVHIVIIGHVAISLYMHV